MSPLLVLVIATGTLTHFPIPDPPAERKPEDQLAGEWLFDRAFQSRKDLISQVWSSPLTITGREFTLATAELPMPLTGTFEIDSIASPKRIDLHLREQTFSQGALQRKLPATKLQGIYSLEQDRLTVRLALPGTARPDSFKGAPENEICLEMVKTPTGFKVFPRDIGVLVSGPDGKPVAGASVATSMMSADDASKSSGKQEWVYENRIETDQKGMASIAYKKLQGGVLIAHNQNSKQIKVVMLTPAGLGSGKVTIALEPQCKVIGEVHCEGVTKIGPLNFLIVSQSRQVAHLVKESERFEFAISPGTYDLEIIGEDLDRKQVSITVPSGVSEHTVAPINIKASRLKMLQGKLAPELTGVTNWKGREIKLADLKGKYVLLDFWGYWCPPCVREVPILSEIHKKFSDRGLEVVGIHVDRGEDLDTTTKLDEMLSPFLKGPWKGLDLSFPVGLVTAKQVSEDSKTSKGCPVVEYGVIGFPTTILIDREGKVMGRFRFRDAKDADQQIEKLLSGK
jgi:uncharacterized protein (TIGR03067 family)